jgi:hypothetical protein
MSQADRAGLCSVNRSVTNLGDGARPLRLPTANPFPKLAQRSSVGAARLSGAVVPAAGNGGLPEMASDVLGVDAGYAVENVKRDRSGTRTGGKAGWTQWMGRVLGMPAPAGRP